MEQKLFKTQLLNDLLEKGCTDSLVCSAVVNQTLQSSDILGTYPESLSFAISLYEARMWGRKKSNDIVRQEQKRREKKFTEPTPCLATPVRQPKPGEIRVGKLILKKRK